MAKSKTYGTTWWGNQWLKALSDIDYSNRIPRGRSYASSGYVFDLQLYESKGLISAKVEGKSYPFYKVTLKFTQVSKEAKEAFMSDLVKDMAIVSKLTNRQLDPRLMELALKHHIKLFPSSWMDLGMNCNCPDFAVPCKHIAAVIYIVSEIIDSNPFVLFTLRGIDLLKEIESRGFNLDEAMQVETVSVAKLHQDATTSIQQLFAQSLLYKIPLEPVVIQRLVDLKQKSDFAPDSYLNPEHIMDVEREGSLYLSNHLDEFEREIKELPASFVSNITEAAQKAQDSSYAANSRHDGLTEDSQGATNGSRSKTVKDDLHGSEDMRGEAAVTSKTALTSQAAVTSKATLTSKEDVSSKVTVTSATSATGSKYARKYVRNNQAASVPFSTDLKAKAAGIANQDLSKLRASAADFEADMLEMEQQFDSAYTSPVQQGAYANLHVIDVSAEDIQVKQARKQADAKLQGRYAGLGSTQGGQNLSSQSSSELKASQTQKSKFKSSQAYENAGKLSEFGEDVKSAEDYAHDLEFNPLDVNENELNLLDLQEKEQDSLDLQQDLAVAPVSMQLQDSLSEAAPHWLQQMSRLKVSCISSHGSSTDVTVNTGFQGFAKQKYGQGVSHANSSCISVDELRQTVLNKKQQGTIAASLRKVATAHPMAKNNMEGIPQQTSQVKFNQGSEHLVIANRGSSLSTSKVSSNSIVSSNTVTSSSAAALNADASSSSLAQNISGTLHLCEVIGQIMEADYEFAHRKKKPGRKSQADIEQSQKIEQAIAKYGSYNVYLALDAASKQTGVEIFGADDKFEAVTFYKQRAMALKLAKSEATGTLKNTDRKKRR